MCKKWAQKPQKSNFFYPRNPISYTRKNQFLLPKKAHFYYPEKSISSTQKWHRSRAPDVKKAYNFQGKWSPWHPRVCHFYTTGIQFFIPEKVNFCYPKNSISITPKSQFLVPQKVNSLYPQNPKVLTSGRGKFCAGQWVFHVPGIGNCAAPNQPRPPPIRRGISSIYKGNPKIAGRSPAPEKTRCAKNRGTAAE